MRHLVVLAVLGWTAPLQGQRIESLRAGIEQPKSSATSAQAFTPVVSEPPRDGLSFTTMTASGMLFAAAGLAAGGFAGAQWTCDTDDMDWCRVGGALLGGMLVETIATPIGVHLVHKKGSLRRELLVSAGISAVGLVAGALAPFPTILLVPLALPPIHIVSTIAIERQAALRELDPQQLSR